MGNAVSIRSYEQVIRLMEFVFEKTPVADESRLRVALSILKGWQASPGVGAEAMTLVGPALQYRDDESAEVAIWVFAARCAERAKLLNADPQRYFLAIEMADGNLQQAAAVALFRSGFAAEAGDEKARSRACHQAVRETLSAGVAT